RRLRLDCDLEDANGRFDKLIGSHRGLRDFFHDMHAFGDAAEDGIFAIEWWLWRNADEELRAVAIGFVRNADGGDDAALVFDVAELGGKHIQSPGAPEVAGRLRVFQKRIASLDESIQEHAKEGAAIVVTGAGEAQELFDVFRGFIRHKFETERAQTCGHHGFEIGWRCCRRLRQSCGGSERQEKKREEGSRSHDSKDNGGNRETMYN